MSNRTTAIAIIDSGIGGLSIFNAVKKIMPLQSIIYCCDSAGFPYGNKTTSNIISRVKDCINKLLLFFDISMVVIGCNTASIHSLQILRSIYNFNIVGVVPAIKTAGLISEKRCIGLLATPQTVSSNYVENLIQKFVSDCKVIKLGSTQLVRLAEARICLGIEPSLAIIKTIIKPLLSQAHNTPDAIVLGCTHFAFIIDLLTKLTSNKIQWIEPSQAIAFRVNSKIKKISKDNTNNNYFIVTCKSKYNNRFLAYLAQIGFQNIRYIHVADENARFQG